MFTLLSGASESILEVVKPFVNANWILFQNFADFVKPYTQIAEGASTLLKMFK